MLPTSLEEALKDFEGDFSGPWRALGLEAQPGSTNIIPIFIFLIFIHKIDNFNGSFFPIFETSPSTDIALAQACDPSVTEDDIRMAYRKAVRLEHPDTSEKPDAEDHRNTMG